jgi:hypothetical protein
MFAVHGDPDGGVEGPVGDLAVLHLHVAGIDEHHRVDAVERRSSQELISSNTASVILEIVSEHSAPHTSGEMRLDLVTTTGSPPSSDNQHAHLHRICELREPGGGGLEPSIERAGTSQHSGAADPSGPWCLTGRP